MSRPAARTARTVTLIADGSPEEAQARLWRPIAQHWPRFIHPPNLQVLNWQQAVEPTTELRGSVALIYDAEAHTSSGLFVLLDRLRDDLIPSVILAHSEDALRDAGADDGAMFVPHDTDPNVTAAMLSAQSERQATIETLRGEIRIARRFQGGLRGEIDKIHEELQLAASVQREFLPRELPKAPNIDVQVLFRPCGYVSGDIYDVQKLSDTHIGFFVADAVGHGVPAALMTMVLCRCLTTRAVRDGREVILSPAEALSGLNQQMVERHGDNPRFATAVYGVIDTRTRTVTLAGAGHPHPLRIRSGSVEAVATEGGLLGVFPEAEFDDTTFTLAPDEMLVVYSDGFETAFPAPSADEYGRRVPNTHYLDRFTTMAAAWRSGGLTGALHELSEQIDRQAGSLHQVDDLTALIVAPHVDRPVDRLFSSSPATGDRPTPSPAPTVPA